MPELPEVEITCRGIASVLEHQVISKVIVRNPHLRWKVAKNLPTILQGQKIQKIIRRGKYILIQCDQGTLIIHLGMSGSLRILESYIKNQKHDHIDLLMVSGVCLRFNDPRRFGCFLWTKDDPAKHSLLKLLGPEPLSSQFNLKYLASKIKKRNTAIKLLIMNSHIVVGVGNIYANEALFAAGIQPLRSSFTLTSSELTKLISAIRKVLRAAIRQGGTTLRNFSSSEGKPGYFKQKLQVYGRGGLPCVKCGYLLEEIAIAKRTTVYCKHCQK